MQDAFVAVHRRWDRIDPEPRARRTCARPWSTGHGARCATAPSSPGTEPDPLPDGARRPTWPCCRPSAARRCSTRWLRLPARQREVLVLRYYLDLSEADIAATLGISRGAVKSHASRGVAALRERLLAEGGAHEQHDDDIRRALHDAVADVEPLGTLDDIRSRTEKVVPMKRWFLPTIAVAAVMAADRRRRFWLLRGDEAPGGSVRHADPARPRRCAAADARVGHERNAPSRSTGSATPRTVHGSTASSSASRSAPTADCLLEGIDGDRPHRRPGRPRLHRPVAERHRPERRLLRRRRAHDRPHRRPARPTHRHDAGRRRARGPAAGLLGAGRARDRAGCRCSSCSTASTPTPSSACRRRSRWRPATPTTSRRRCRSTTRRTGRPCPRRSPSAAGRRRSRPTWCGS